MVDPVLVLDREEDAPAPSLDGPEGYAAISESKAGRQVAEDQGRKMPMMTRDLRKVDSPSSKKEFCAVV